MPTRTLQTVFLDRLFATKKQGTLMDKVRWGLLPPGKWSGPWEVCFSLNKCLLSGLRGREW